MRLQRPPVRAGAKGRRMPSGPGVSRTHTRARGAPAVLLVMLVALSAGCASDRGATAVKSSGPAPSSVNLAQLDSGSYPPAPRPPLGTVPNEDAGRLVESLRRADNPIGPWEVEPALLDSHGSPTGAMPTVESLSMLFSGTMAARAGAHHYLLGFLSGRASGSADKLLNNAVLRFASPDDAAAAVA